METGQEATLAIEQLDERNVCHLSAAFVERELKQMHKGMFDFLDWKSPLRHVAIHTRSLFLILPCLHANPWMLYYQLTRYRRLLEKSFKSLDAGINPDNDPVLAHRQFMAAEGFYSEY